MFYQTELMIQLNCIVCLITIHQWYSAMISRSVFPTPSRAIALQFFSQFSFFFGCVLFVGIAPTTRISYVYPSLLRACMEPIGSLRLQSLFQKGEEQKQHTRNSKYSSLLFPCYHYNMSTPIPRWYTFIKFSLFLNKYGQSLSW